MKFNKAFKTFLQNPGSTTPKASPGLASQSPSLERKLLAFRTISAMLQYIPEEEPFQVETKQIRGPEDHQLNILKAFATLGVTKNEVIAIVVKIDPIDPLVLEVIASIQADDNKSLWPSPPQKPKSTLLGRWISFYSTNSGSARGSNQSVLGAGTVKSIDVGPPDNLNIATAQEITNYITSYQSAYARPSLATHLYIIKEGLTMKNSNGDRITTFESVNLLRKYIVVTCYQKIRRRLTHATLALPLLESLRQVPRPIVFNKAAVQDPSDAERLYDREFLSIVVDGQPSLRTSKTDDPGLPIPKLLNEAKKSEDHEPFQLYSEATCDEFHALFLLYLNCFQESLEDLDACICPPLQDPPIVPPVNEIGTASSLVLLYATTLQTLIRGSALRNHLETIEPSIRKYHKYHVGFAPNMKLPKMKEETLAAHGKEQDEEQAAKAQVEDKGKAREQDAEQDGEQEEQAVKAQTEDKGKAREQDAEQDDEQDDDPQDDDEQDDNPQDDDPQDDDPQDDDLRAVQPTVVQGGAPVLLWKSYKNWLKLIVVHFDSIDILAQHFSNNNTHTINLKILEAPPVEKGAKMLPFRELLRDADLFPPSDVKDPDGPDNEQLLKKLTGIPFNRLRVLNDDCVNVKKCLQRGDYPMCLTVLQRISDKKKSDVTPWSTHAKKLVTDFKDTTFPSFEVEADANQLSSLRAFAQGVQSLHDSVAYLYRFHEDMNFFLGSVHCEAILASFLCVPHAKIPKLDPNSSIYKNLQGASRLIGVSKNCCPVCEHLLFLLSKDRISKGRQLEDSCYIVRGSHKTVTACSLPPWLPEHIVDAMNLHFGDELRKKLVKFDSTIQQGRPSSTGSDGFSVKEMEGQMTPLPKCDVDDAKAKRWIRHGQYKI